MDEEQEIEILHAYVHTHTHTHAYTNPYLFKYHYNTRKYHYVNIITRYICRDICVCACVH